jgi:ABC-type lipoprotein export system ATPase subunit
MAQVTACSEINSAGDSLPSSSVIEAVDVDVVYGNVWALREASISVASGEWIAVTGPSGSGKSTLLQLFAALDVPTRGQIRFKGQDLFSVRHLDRYRRKQVGLVFQLHNLLPHLDAVQNVEVAMFGTRHARRYRFERAMELLSLVDLTSQAGRIPPEMSGGERQRVAIARALANQPSILLADEPTGSLDPEGVQNVMEVLDRLHRSEGMTIIMVTHDRDLARLADRVVRIEAGRVLNG